MTEFVFRSSIDVAELKALERLVFFNPRQHAAESGITRGVELYGSPAIVAEADGLRVVVSRRKDVQCLFALAPGRSGLALAGMVVYLRTSVDEILVLHIAVAERFSRSRQSGLRVVMALVRSVREVAHRLRGVERLRMLYLDGRQFRVPIKTSRAEAIGDPAMACRAS